MASQTKPSATPTVLTCGQLRLSVPQTASTPSLRVLPGATPRVEITFTNFSGPVFFELINPDPPTNPSPTPPSTTPLSPSPSPLVPSSPPPVAPSTHPLPSASSPDQTPTLSQLTQPLSYSQQPLSHPVQLLPASQPFTLSQLQSQPLFPSPPRFPSPSQHPSTLSPSRFPHHNYMPLTPPSDDDNHLESSQDHLLYAPHPAEVSAPVPPSPKKRSPPRVNNLAVKQGKRVRFQSDPEVFSQSPVPPRPTETAPSRGPKSPFLPLVLAEDSVVVAARWGATMTCIDNDTMALLGGESESGGIFQDLSLLDISGGGAEIQGRWTCNPKDTPAMPGTGRAWHTTTFVDDKLFVFGGEKEVDGVRVQTNDTIMYDAAYYSWYPPALQGTGPSPRAGHCAAVLPGTRDIVVYGGICGNKWLNDMFVLEEVNAWRKVRLSNRSVRPAARAYASMTLVGKYIVLFGGNNKTRCFNDVHLMQNGDLTWTEPVVLGRKPAPRTGHSAVPAADKEGVVVYGGWDDQGVRRHFFSDVWELRIKSAGECVWTCLFQGDQASRTPGPRAGAALCRAGDRVLLFGGWHLVQYFSDVSQLVLPQRVAAFGSRSA